MVQPHIHLSEELGVKYAILPGDPGRVTHIKEFLDNAEEVTFNREYRSAIGTYKGVKVLALSTGMDGVSVGIALEELKKNQTPSMFGKIKIYMGLQSNSWTILPKLKIY